MGRPDRVCLFASARWSAFSPFSYPRGRVQTRAGRMGRPTGDALRLGGEDSRLTDISTDVRMGSYHQWLQTILDIEN
jgi:hypothetical protein